ncbi:MAG: sugar nucleotide-binding protein [Dehalococcoidia bacterium]|jgi:dTDP-4-dehydrorhamnose reductase
MKLLVLGHYGMLGNAVHKYFTNKCDIETIEGSRWDSDEYKNRILNSDAEFIVNCVGAIPQKKYNTEYYKFLNVELPKFLETTGKKVVHPSTDCEFSGYLAYPKTYKWNDWRDAEDDYGKSKAEISKLIVDEFKNTKIIRTSIIGHELITSLSLLDWFLGTDDDEVLKGYSNYFWNGITTLQWCKVAEVIISDWKGAFILTQVGSLGLSKYDLLKIIGEVYSKPNIINKFEMEKPLNKMLEPDFETPIIKDQLIELKEFYDK